MRAADPEKWTFSALASLFNCPTNTVRFHLDPEYKKQQPRKQRAIPYVVRTERPIEWEELKERRALIPIDNRDTTGRLMGDPIPGDRRRRVA
jgi:hypothetical protein